MGIASLIAALISLFILILKWKFKKDKLKEDHLAEFDKDLSKDNYKGMSARLSDLVDKLRQKGSGSPRQ